MGLYDEDVQFPKTIYDPETGEEEQSSLLDKEELYIAEAVKKGEELEILRKSQGYKLLESWLKSQIDQYTEALVWERDEKKVYRLQEAIKCYSNIAEVIDNSIREAQILKETQRDNSSVD
jgi:hypothetical protein